MLAADIEDDGIGRLSRRGVMHLAARSQNLRLIGFEVKVEMRERMRFDIARRVAQSLEFRQARDGLGALDDEAVARVMQRVLQLRVSERAMRVGGELRGASKRDAKK